MTQSTQSEKTAQASTKPTPAALARNYETVALVLQGCGALGAYQCGVYEGMHAAGLRLDWFAGISIGAINAAILAGNPPEQRVARLREFWELICDPARTTCVASPANENLARTSACAFNEIWIFANAEPAGRRVLRQAQDERKSRFH